MKMWQLENHRKLTLLAIFNFHLANWENLAKKRREPWFRVSY